MAQARTSKENHMSPLILHPTETVYGLGCDARDAQTLGRIFALKGREANKSVGLIAADLEMVERTVVLSSAAREIAKKYWPGALAIIAPVRAEASLASQAVAADGTVAIRVSDSQIARDLASRMGAPLVSTSANRAGQPACSSVQALREQLGEADFAMIDEVIDVGQLPPRLPSTIIRVAEDGGITVVRQGSVAITEEHTTV